MANEPKPIVIADLRGGRNDTDPPMSLPFNQCTEALNVDWKDATLAHKRGGSTAVAESGGTAFSSGIQTIESHVPGAAGTARELWGVDGAATPIVKRMAGGTSFANVTLDDAIATKPQEVVGVALNGKRFFAYDSTQDRLHVYDPGLTSPRIRRVGLPTPTAAPTVADQGAGAYAAVLRYYRVRWLQLNAATTVVIRRSEPSASRSFTPSGTGQYARVTQPTVPGEGETHWEIEISPDDATWYRVYAFRSDIMLAIAIATTFKDDEVVAANYPLAPGTEVEGTYGLFPSVKSLITDGNRLLGAGAWEASGANSGGKTSRVWFTPVLGSGDIGDDERVMNTTTQKGWLDLNENSGGAVTALGGPINGIPYAFKYREVHKLRPTGDSVVPYLPRRVRDDIGCIAHKTVAIGEDQSGQPALYFLSHRGPYRINVNGLVEYLGRDNEVTWRSMNLAATTVVAHSLYYPDLHQWWLWIATGSANDPDVKMMFDVQLGFPDQNGQIRGGWAKHTGDSAVARCSCLMSNTLAASMSLDLKPYIGRASGTVIQKCDTTDADDGGTDFQAYVTTRPLLTTGDVIRKVGCGESTLIGKALASSDVSVTINRDFGKETRTHSVSLAPAASETRLIKKVEGSEMGEADAIQITVGDSAANEEKWTVDAIVVPIIPQERR